MLKPILWSKESVDRELSVCRWREFSMYPLADIAIGETENGIGIHVMTITLDLGNFGFGGLQKGLALSAAFDAF